MRTRFTLLAYFMLAYYAFIQAALGPLMPFLRSELALSYSVGGLHITAFALGMIPAGLLTERIAERWGRRRTFWGGAFGMAIGTLLLILGRREAITIAGSFVMGLLGSFLLIMIQATLSDEFGDKRAIALTESNIWASFAAGLAAFLVGGAEGIGLGWRAAMIAGIVAMLAVWLYTRPIPIPEAKIHTETVALNGRLPHAFWAYFVFVLFGVAIEWCLVFWGADYLENVVGLDKALAATLMSVFFAAVVTGRIVGSRLTHTVNSAILLRAAVGIALAGFLVFWLASSQVLNVAGLFVAGLGIANFYPLSLATMTGLAPQQANIASARTSLGSGIAILVAPQILSTAADIWGIRAAYGFVAALLVASAAITIWAGQQVARSVQTANQNAS
jgi:MFS family permease